MTRAEELIEELIDEASMPKQAIKAAKSVAAKHKAKVVGSAGDQLIYVLKDPTDRKAANAFMKELKPIVNKLEKDVDIAIMSDDGEFTVDVNFD